MVRFIAIGLLAIFVPSCWAPAGFAQGMPVSEGDLEIYSCGETDGTILLLHLNGPRVLAIAEADLGYGKETEPGVFFFYLPGGFARLSSNELLLVETASEIRVSCKRIDEVWREAIQMLIDTPYVRSVELESVSSPNLTYNDEDLQASKAIRKALSLQLELVRESLEEAKEKESLYAAQVKALRNKLDEALATAAVKEKRIRELERE